MKFFLAIIPFILCGCVVLRYNFETALNNLPEGYKLIKLTNYHIDYCLGNVLYRAYYDVDGVVYETKTITLEISQY